MRLLKRLLKFVVGLAVLMLLASAALVLGLWILNRQPVTLPAPTGPYAVGRVEYDWADQSRAETFGPGRDGHRELDAWVWYPAGPESSAAAPTPYMPAAWRAAREQMQQPAWLAKFLIQDLSLVQVHAVADRPLASDKPAYPVLVLQPGLGPLLPDYTTLAEDLASHGYVVVGSTPTYSAAVVVFPDGHVAQGTPAGSVSDLATPREAQQILDRLIQVWAADDVFVLNQMKQLNQADPQGRFTGRLDLRAVGVWGHSFGGASAAEAVHLDPRFRAGLNLDGYPFGDVVQAGVDRPFMTIWSEPPNQSDPAWQQARRDIGRIESRLGPDGYQLMIRGARHFNFTDNSVFLAPFLRLRGGLGSIDGRRFLAITAVYVRAFFDQYLQALNSPLLAGPSAQYTEVQFVSR